MQFACQILGDAGRVIIGCQGECVMAAERCLL